MTDHDWTQDEHGVWNLRHEGVWVWIEPRPSYCDRGHFIGKVMGLDSIDDADAFPRYYMNLERAKLEMSEWLTWRMRREKDHER